MQHLRAVQRKMQHIAVVDTVEPHRTGNKSGIGCVYSVNVGVYLASVGFQGGGKLHCRRVRAAAAESRCVAAALCPLKACRNDDLSGHQAHA